MAPDDMLANTGLERQRCSKARDHITREILDSGMRVHASLRHQAITTGLLGDKKKQTGKITWEISIENVRTVCNSFVFHRIAPQSLKAQPNPEEPIDEDENVQAERLRTSDALSTPNLDEVGKHRLC